MGDLHHRDCKRYDHVQVPELEQDFRLLRYDSRGHGGNQATEGDYSFDMRIDTAIDNAV